MILRLKIILFNILVLQTRVYQRINAGKLKTTTKCAIHSLEKVECTQILPHSV